MHLFKVKYTHTKGTKGVPLRSCATLSGTFVQSPFSEHVQHFLCKAADGTVAQHLERKLFTSI